MPYSETAHGDGDVASGHSKGGYGAGKVPIFKDVKCLGGTSACPAGCYNCKAGQVQLTGGACTKWCSRSGYCGASSAHINGGTDCNRCGSGGEPTSQADFPERDEHPTAIDVVKFHLAQSTGAKNRDVDPLGFPWPLVPYGYYAPTRECEWVLQNRNKGCPYTMDLFKWITNKVPVSSNPLCKKSDWHPNAIPRISEDGRVCGGCSYHSFAKASCLGKVAGRRPEPGHSGDFIFTYSGTGKSRTFSVSSPWMVSAGYKKLNGRNTHPVSLIEMASQMETQEKWAMDTGVWADLESMAKAMSKADGVAKFDIARLAGMMAEHTYWYVDEATRRDVLKPLAE